MLSRNTPLLCTNFQTRVNNASILIAKYSTTTNVPSKNKLYILNKTAVAPNNMENWEHRCSEYDYYVSHKPACTNYAVSRTTNELVAISPHRC